MGNFKKKEFGGSRDGGRRDNKRFGGSKNFSGNRGGGFGRRDSDRGTHKAVCAKCGTDCDLPFRPTGNKPVFCSDCYRKDGSARPSSEFSDSRSSSRGGDSMDFKKELAEIHEKLDMIIDMLEDASDLDDDEEEDK